MQVLLFLLKLHLSTAEPTYVLMVQWASDYMLLFRMKQSLREDTFYSLLLILKMIA